MSQLLPLYHKYGGTFNSRGRRGNLPLRLREAHLLLFLFLTFSLAWCVLVIYMPETQTTDTGFEATYQKFIHRSLDGIEAEQKPQSPALLPGEGDNNNKNMGPPKIFRPPSVNDPNLPKTPVMIRTASAKPSVASIPVVAEVVKDPPQREEEKVSKDDPRYGSDDDDRSVNSDAVNQERREKVKEMIKHAWDGYVKYAFGENELKPISKIGHSAAIFGKTKLGATLVDSLDTLYIVGMREEFDQAKEWVEKKFTINEIDSAVSFFEFNIRFIGGFLSAYALSGEEVFKYKAVSLADKLMPVFNNDTGLPSSFINMQTGTTKNWGWAKTSSVLSEIGTLHLEYQYLTELTNSPVYLNKVERVRKKLKSMPKSDGMYNTLISQRTQNFGNKVSSLGALGDSFYEYLLKSWLITSKEDTEGRDMFYAAIDALEKKMLMPKPDGVLMVTDFRNSKSDQMMQHLACFSGGMYALGSVHAANGKADHYLSIAKNITYTCRKSYNSTATKLGPERFRVDNSGKFSSRGNSDKMYLLRPETVESYFYMWRLTRDPKYREWGWDVVQALEKQCRTANGYSGIRDVYQSPPVKDDVQQSFFIAETLKYLYLLFSDDSIIPLDKWVFNTEAHPLPILQGIPKPTKHSESHDVPVGNNLRISVDS